jgi:transposase InsO family protein
VSLARLIAAQRTRYGIPHATGCRALGVSQAWFYKWLRGEVSVRRARRAALAALIAYLFKLHHGTYGSPRIHADLRDLGWRVSKNTVAKLMAEQGLVARPKRKRRSLTKADKAARKAPDMLQRDFAPPERPNTRWVGDLTDIPNDEGKFYLAAILDLHSRRCVGFAMGTRHDAELAKAALCVAIAIRGGHVAGVIMHTDQGGEYTGALFAAACTAAGITQSMGRTGSALDKSLVSHCTSWWGFDEDSFVESFAHAFDESGVAGRGCFEEAFVLVVGLVGGQQPGAVPGLDGGGVHAEPLGDLAYVEQSLRAEPFGVAGECVAAA